MADRPIINGVFASWSNMKIKVRGDDLGVDLVDFNSFEWKQALEPGVVRGKGSGPRGSTEGDYTAEAKLGLLKDQQRLLLQALAAKHPKRKAGLVYFDVIVQWTPEDAADPDVVLEIEARGCRIKEAGGSASPGPDPIAGEVPLWVTRLFEDGVCLIGDE